LDAGVRTLLVLLGKSGTVMVRRDDEDGMCFDVLPPAGVDSRVWADATARLFSDHHFNVVAAPARPV